MLTEYVRQSLKRAITHRFAEAGQLKVISLDAGIENQIMGAVKKLDTGCGLFVCNLGTGKGYSVLDVLHAYEKACGRTLPYSVDPRRPGDIAQCYADPAKARDELGWEAQYGIDEMCASSWKWQSMNPNGYKGGTEQ